MINKLSRLFEKSVKIAILLLLIVFFLNVTGVLELDKVQKAFVITTLFSLWLLRIEITVVDILPCLKAGEDVKTILVSHSMNNII
ncbi:hypothetical protein ACMXZD_06330 [Pasteurella multocida]